MENLLFSIVVPIYNVERYLKNCLDSIINQSYKNFEVILVDDGSPDNCPQICDEYAKKDSRFKVVHKQNGGLVSARQAGANAASGDYIVCIDSDDWVDVKLLEHFAEALSKKKADLVCCGYIKTSEKSEKNIKIPFDYDYYDRADIEKKLFPSLMQKENATYFPPSQWAKAYEKSLYVRLQNNIDRTISIGEDSALAIPFLYNSNSVWIIEDCLYYYRANEYSMTKQKKAFSFMGPKILDGLLKDAINLKDFDFEQQLYRKTVHELFTVVVSQFNKKQSYFKTVKEIKEELKYPAFSEAIKKAKFAGSKKAKLMELSLKNSWFLLIWLYNKIKSE